MAERTFDRREFLKALGGGILVVFTIEDALAQEESGGGARRPGAGERAPRDVGAWLHIGADGAVTVYTGKVEVGQGTRTALTQIVAEELPAPLAKIRLVMGDTDLTPFDAGTFGSRSIPFEGPQLRRAAAVAREMLFELAARRWNIARADMRAEDGQVINARTGAALGFGELTTGERLVRTIAEDVPVTAASEWKIAGASVPRVDGRLIVTGRHEYPSDVKRPGMLHGKVLRPPVFGATLTACDASGAEAMPGVTVVRDGDFAGVAAPDPETASRALAALKAEWKTSPQPSGREIFEYLKKHPAGRATSPRESGSVAKALAEAPVRLRQSYTVAYIAHAPLEPRAAVAEWVDGKLTVWTGTQRPFGVQGELASAFGLPNERVRVIMPDTGSGYGGKHTGDAAIEAARLARAEGKPVKVVWTREEEFTWAYFRPAGVIEVAGGATRDGRITAWEFTNYNSGAAGLQMAYDIPNHRIAFQPAQSPLRQGSYRALAATANHFARETHIDELAHACTADPLQFRLKNTRDERFRAVLVAAAERFGWGKGKPGAGRGFGMAAGWEKGSYVATCAEVSVSGSVVKVERVVQAFECGAIVNPEILKNQVEGMIVQGLGGALFEAVEFEDGRILNPRFSRYRVPRFSDVPPMEIVLLDRKDLPSAGGGETPIVGIAPAVGNAIFAATGKRLRSLPLTTRAATAEA